MATYPSSIWSGNTRGTNLADAHTHTKWHDDIMGEVIAMQTELGTAPSGSSATVTAKIANLAVTSTSYTPTWVNMTIGSGTNVGVYARIGPVVVASYVLGFGVGTAFTGGPAVDLPIAGIQSILMGSCHYTDAGTRNYIGVPAFVDANTVAFAHTESGNAGTVDATNPFTWTNGDFLRATIVYFAA